MVHHPIHADPNGGEANYITFDAPDATVNDGSSEEIEIDTGLNLGDRLGMRVLGVQVQELLDVLYDALPSSTGATTLHRRADVQLNTRTGDFHRDDPENIYTRKVAAIMVSDGTNMAGAGGPTDTVYGVPDTGEVVVTPRLVFRFANNTGTNLNAGNLFVRIGYEFQNLGEDEFLELLEKHADIFLA